MEEKKLSLLDISSTQECLVVKVNGHGGFRHRIMEMGFIRGAKVTVVKNAPLQDPIEYRIMQCHVSLRRSEAAKIEVVRMSDEMSDESHYNGTISESIVKKIKEKNNVITVALVGNPNSGKTSFFNHATGLHERVGNYGGVTVESKIGVFHHKGYKINLVDLPGTYSMTEFSPEEIYVRKFIAEEQPDVVLNIVDASNLERNMFLTTQLIDMNVRIVMALNMYDELTKSGAAFDYENLSKMLGFPIIPTMAYKGTGITDVLESIIDMFEDKEGVSKHIHINYGQDIEDAIGAIKKEIHNNKEITTIYPARYIAIKLLEGDKLTEEELLHVENAQEIVKVATHCRENIERLYNEEASGIITNAKYGFIHGALKETFVPGNKEKKMSNAVDTVLTNKWLGFPVLFLFLWIMFQATFNIGAYPQEWIEMGVGWLSEVLLKGLPEGAFTDLLIDGILAGVGGVIVFLPNILILFLFISLMEDTGYMARAAFIMDKLMHKIGLHGKSFIPLLMGFGCSVPAIMGTRTLENKKDRILTVLVIPFISCSARLPVYLLLVSAFFVENQGLILLSIYLIGILLAVLTAKLLNKTALKGESTQFVMELPPYRIPTFRNTMIHMWDKGSQYLRKMGTVILLASVVIWALGYFPQHSEEIDSVADKIVSVENNNDYTEEQKEELLTEYELEKSSLQTENSYIGRIGHFIEPVVRPLGFDWKMGVSILTGFAAKEIVVSSMGILYQADLEADETSERLIENLKGQKYTSGSNIGQPVFTPLVAYSFMLFILLYFPCVAAISAIKKEAGWRWMLFSIFYTTGLAWVVSFLVFQIGSLL
jgi:ferrous iron transport protein B